ncbi:MAG TPA: DinB family protein, partial [Bryobacteraceae bacterium]|nr:DinB family protein [Bryobacteraceae bacterium]
MRLALITGFCICLLDAAEPQQLFNGKDLSGWEMVGNGHFVVENGQLRTEGGMGLLWYRGRKFGNETVRVVFRTPGEHGNSGVYIRIPEAPPDPWYGVHYGYEVQIDAAQDDWHSTGAIYSLSPVLMRAQKPRGEWNTLDIQLDGQITRVYLNGKLVNRFDPQRPVADRKMWYEPVRGPRPDSGYIGLQNHDAQSVVYFREVSVRSAPEVEPLVPAPLSSGERNVLLSYLHSSRRQVMDSIVGLSPEQLNYKPAPERWSVAEIVEHLALTEDLIRDAVRKALASAAPAAAPDGPTDQQIIDRYKDRVNRAEAPPALRPGAKWKTAGELT